MIDALLMEIDREAKTTRAVLKAVPDGKWGWKPHEKSMTLGGLAHHVAQLPAWGGLTLAAGETDFEKLPKATKPTNNDELLALFEKGIQALRGAVQASSASELAEKTYTMRRGEKVFLTAPRAVFLRSMLLNHQIHHRGQLSVYLRLLDVPVPSLYGPSADENPWA